MSRFGRSTEIQRSRRKTIRDVCLRRRHKLPSNQSTGGKPRPRTSTNQIPALSLITLKHIYVSDKHRFMYCYVANAGCSNWTRVMKNLDLNIDDSSSREADSQNGLKTLRNYAPEQRKWRLKTYKKFLFVRNPVSRIISAYRNKFQDLDLYRRAPLYGIRRYGQHIVKKYRADAMPREVLTGENVTWSEWMAYLTNRVEEANFGERWMQMSRLCSPCDVDYDYIGKLESLSDDVGYITSALNLTDVVHEFPGRENSHLTDASMDVAKSYFEGISKKQKWALWETYQLDFQLFGYEKPDFLE